MNKRVNKLEKIKLIVKSWCEI